jgi:sulfotransferase family protein
MREHFPSLLIRASVFLRAASHLCRHFVHFVGVGLLNFESWPWISADRHSGKQSIRVINPPREESPTPTEQNSCKAGDSQQPSTLCASALPVETEDRLGQQESDHINPHSKNRRHGVHGSSTSINRPVFVVGSPRSGTSILTWCLGQHPNIFPIDESTGIAELAVALAVCHQTKIGLGPDSLWSMLNVQQDEFFVAFGQTINELIQRHKVDLERKWWEQTFAPNPPPHEFVVAKATNATKTRWVDGTPAYSFHICSLRKLFPDAQFIHIVRDVTSVVRSMLNFHRLAGVKLVANEQEAYDYWYRAVTACLLAEQAYGPQIVFRLRYSELVDQAEVSLRALLDFLGEPYTAKCLIPLRERINSSNVPADFRLGDPDSDPEIIDRAIRLNAEIETSLQPHENLAIAADQLETEFTQRVQYVAALDSKYSKAHAKYVKAHARAEGLAKEVENKRAIIQELRSRR